MLYNKKISEDKIEIAKEIYNGKISYISKMYDETPKFKIPLTNFIEINDVKESDCFILYFDLLGYKSKMKIYGENYYLKLICAIIDTIKSQSETSDDSPWAEGMDSLYGYHIFSDNIIIYRKKVNDVWRDVFQLYYLINDAFSLQRNIMGQYRSLVRGAITQGKIYYDGSFIYGSGLINAVQLEEDAAYPRIVIDNSCLDYLDKASMNLDGIESAVIKNIIERAEYLINQEDHVCYIGYLNCAYGVPDNIFVTYLYFHKRIIETEIQNNKEDTVKNKLLWCKEYHNSICDIYGLEELKILLM